MNSLNTESKSAGLRALSVRDLGLVFNGEAASTPGADLARSMLVLPVGASSLLADDGCCMYSSCVRLCGISSKFTSDACLTGRVRMFG